MLLHYHIIFKICQLQEHLYAGIIFNYGLFLLIALGLKYIYAFIKSRVRSLKGDAFLLLKKYFILIIQYLLIFTFVTLAFYFNLNWNWKNVSFENSDNNSYFILLFSTTSINFIMSIILVGLIYKKKDIDKNIRLYIYEVLYVPFIIIYSILLSAYISPIYILIMFVIILLNLFAIELFIFIFNSSNIGWLFFSALTMDVVSILIFKFILKIGDGAVIAYSIVSFVYIGIWAIASFACKYNHLNNVREYYNISFLGFNYTNFVLAYLIKLQQ